MDNKFRRIVSLILVFLLSLGSLPTNVLASEGSKEGVEKEKCIVSFSDEFGKEITFPIDKGDPVSIPTEFSSPGQIITSIYDEEDNRRNPSLQIFKDENFEIEYGDSIEVELSMVGDTRHSNKGDQIIQPTKVTITADDIKRQEKDYGLRARPYVTVANALYKALEADPKLKEEIPKIQSQVNNNYIGSMFGLEQKSLKDEKDGWMYFNNDKFVGIGLTQAPVLDEDYIHWFYVENYENNSYTWFKERTGLATQGQPYELELSYSKYDTMGGSTTFGKYHGATILVDDKEYKQDGQLVKTDKDGKANIIVNEPGKHIITAKHIGENNQFLMTIPYMTLIVELAKENSSQVEEIEKWAKDKMEAIEKSYLEKEKHEDWWVIAELGKRGHAMTPATMSWLLGKTLDKSGQVIKDTNALTKNILALRASGIDPEDYYGHNLVEEFLKLDLRDRGVFAQAPAINTLASDEYKALGIKEKLKEEVENLLEQRDQEGLWNNMGWQDATGFALYALAPYYNTDTKVKEAVEQAVNTLAKKQFSDGSFSTNSNSHSMVAGGLLSCNPAYLKDTRLIKNGKTMLHGLKEFEVPGKPQFYWKKGQDAGSLEMATEQAFRALVTYFEGKEGKGMVFDYKNLPKESITEAFQPPVSEIKILPETIQIKVDQELEIKAQITPSSIKEVPQWKVEDPTIAQVKEGKVLGKKIGSTKLTAELRGVKATAEIKVVDKNAVEKSNVHFITTDGQRIDMVNKTFVLDFNTRGKFVYTGPQLKKLDWDGREDYTDLSGEQASHYWVNGEGTYNPGNPKTMKISVMDKGETPSKKVEEFYIQRKADENPIEAIKFLVDGQEVSEENPYRMKGSEEKSYTIMGRRKGSQDWIPMKYDEFEVSYDDGYIEATKFDPFMDDEATFHFVYRADENIKGSFKVIVAEEVEVESMKVRVPKKWEIDAWNNLGDYYVGIQEGSKNNQYQIDFEPSNATNTEVKWEALTPEIAEHMKAFKNGIVPKKAGMARFKVTSLSNPDLEEEVEVEFVYKHPLKKAQGQETYKVKEGQSISLPLSFEPANATEKRMTWTYKGDGEAEVKTSIDHKSSMKDKETLFKLYGKKTGKVTVTGHPIDTSGGAEAITFNVLVTDENGEIPNEEQNPVDKTALEKALEKVDEVKMADTTSDDGTDVDTDKTWVSPEAQKALDDAKSNAQKMLADPKASLDQVKDAADELNQALSIYKPVFGTKTKFVEKAGLEEALEAAKKVVPADRTSRDGTEVGKDSTWVSPEVQEALDNAKTKAEKILLKDGATKEEVEEATGVLNAAIANYKPQAGTKVEEPQEPQEPEVKDDLNTIIRETAKDIIDRSSEEDTLSYLQALSLNNAKQDLKSFKDRISILPEDKLVNVAENIISILAAGENPSNYKGENYISGLPKKVSEFSDMDIKDIVILLIAMDKAGIQYDGQEAMNLLLDKLTVDEDEAFVIDDEGEEWGYVDDIKDTNETIWTLIGLSKYKKNPQAQEKIEKTKNYLKKQLQPNGQILREWIDDQRKDVNTSSLLVQALIRLGEDPSGNEWTHSSGKSLVDGIVSEYKGKGEFRNPSNQANAFAALVDYKNKTSMFDGQGDLPKVIFKIKINVLPKQAKNPVIVISKKDSQEPIDKINEVFELEAGKYTVKVTADGYKDKVEDFSVSEDKELSLSLEGVEKPVDKTKLKEALEKANKAKADATSANGEDIAKAKTWVRSEVQKALDKAKAKAEEILTKAAATKEEVEEATDALNAAIGNYKPQAGSKAEEAKEPQEPEKVDKTALQKVLDVANKAKADATSANGEDIAKGKTWVRPEAQEALDKAKAKAKEILSKDGATKEEVEEATDALNAAMENYKPQAGTQKTNQEAKPEPAPDKRQPKPVGTGLNYWSNPEGAKGEKGVKALEEKKEKKPEISPEKNKMEDIKGHWAEKVIDYVLEKGYFFGTSDSTFTPNRNITRGEFVTVLGRMEKIDPKAQEPSPMTDLEEKSYYEAYVNWAIKQGIAKGIGDKQFAPNRSISREEMAAFLSRYLQVKGKAYTSGQDKIYRDDKEIANWSKKDVYSLTKGGILTGQEDNQFAPKKKVSRGEVAQVLYNLDAKK